MLLVRRARDLKRILAVKERQRRMRVDQNRVFLIQMDKQLLYLPDAVLLDGLRIVGRVRCKLERLARRLRDLLVLPMPVFALDVLREYDERTQAAVGADKVQKQVLVPEQSALFLLLRIADVRHAEKHGTVPKPHRPCAVFRLGDALAVRRRDVDDRAGVPLLRAVDRNHAAQKQHVVVRMRGDQQVIKVIRRFQKVVERIGQLARAVHGTEPHDHFGVPALHDRLARIGQDRRDRFGKRAERLIRKQRSVGIVLQHADAVRQFEPLQAEPRARKLLLPGHGKGRARLEGLTRYRSLENVLPRLAVTGEIEGHSLRQVLRFRGFGMRGQDRRKQQYGQYADDRKS